MNYGLPYQGSKQKIAQSIIKFLPAGKRLIDLFGGGGAITHCAVLSGKWEQVLYNELDPAPCQLLREAIDGKYNYNKFLPAWVSREDFIRLKDKDPYIKYVWSFSNAGKKYLYSKEKEYIKHLANDLVVFGKASKELERMFKGIHKAVNSSLQIQERRRIYTNFVKKYSGREFNELQHLEHLERLQHLEHLEHLKHLERLEIHCGSYLDYEYQDGDIVYCDPPYENTTEYQNSFESHRFYDWVASRPFQVWFSSYDISDKRFEIVWGANKLGLMNKTEHGKIKLERIYTNRK